MNLNNYGIIRGRLVTNPTVITNPDNSSRVKLTIAVEDNFKSRDGKRKTQMIPVEAFTRDFSLSAFSRLHKDDKISATYSLRNSDDATTGGIIVLIEEFMFETE